MTLLAQIARPMGAWGLGEILIGIIVIGGLIAIALIAMRGMGFSPPPWAVQIFWVVVIVIVAILAIRFILSL